jgi:hypothetical protein
VRRAQEDTMGIANIYEHGSREKNTLTNCT